MFMITGYKKGDLYGYIQAQMVELSLFQIELFDTLSRNRACEIHDQRESDNDKAYTCKNHNQRERNNGKAYLRDLESKECIVFK